MAKVIYCDATDLQSKIKEAEKMLTGNSIHAALSSALNRTLTYVGSETKRQVQSEYAVTKSINKSLSMEKATRAKLIASANYTDKPIPMFVFKHKVAANKYRSPISITIKKSNGTQTHTGSNPAVFKAYNNAKIIRREAGQRNLKTAYTVSIPQMVASDAVYDVIANKAETKLYERIDHEIEWRIKQI